MEDNQTMDMESSLEKCFRLINESHVKEPSAQLSASLTAKVAARSILSRLIIFLTVLPLAGAMIPVTLNGDMDGWTWVFMGLWIGSILISLAGITFIITGITGLSTLGSILVYNSNVKYFGVVRTFSIAEENGHDVDDLKGKMIDDHEDYITTILELINVKNGGDVDPVLNARDEFNTSVDDLSSLVYLKISLGILEESLMERGVKDIEKILNTEDDTTIRDHLVDKIGDTDGNSFDIQEARKQYERMRLLEDITKFRGEESTVIPDTIN